MKESKAMMKKEVAFMKKKGAPKSMIKHEEKEMKGGKKRFQSGGMPPTPSPQQSKPRGDGWARYIPERATQSTPAPMSPSERNPRGAPGRFSGRGPRFANGGSVYRKGADGVAHKGKTKGKVVKMRYGGEC